MLPGRGVPIQFSRSYFSQSTFTGTLGFRWMHNYEISLSVGADLTATLRYNSGNLARFAQSGGAYVSPPGDFDVLGQNGDGTYTLTTTRQIKNNFPSGGALQSIQDRSGNTTTLGYSSGLLTNVTDPGGRSITITYNVDNRISSITDPLSRTVQYGYSTAGDLITVTNTAGELTLYTYDNHRLVSARDNAGSVLFYNWYDTANRVITQTLASAYTTTFAYNSPSAGQTTVTDPRGNATVYYFDTRFRTSDIKDAYDNYISYGYDTNNRVLTATNQLGQSTYYAYDSKGNPTMATDALGKTSIYTYTALNDLSAQTDPLGRTTSYGYDANGNLTSVTDPLNQVTSLGRDAQGQLTVITNTLGYTTTFDYDSHGNATGTTNALGKRQAFAYDVVGRNTSTTDPRSQTTTFQYDGAGRVLTVTNPLTQTQSFNYDSGGHGALAKSWDAASNLTEYGRNTLDWLTSVAQQIDGSSQTASYTYDANSSLTNQRFASYQYDKLNRPITVTDRLTSVSNSITSTTLSVYTYTLDSVGKRTQVQELSGTKVYTYNEPYWLKNERFADGSVVTYTYTISTGNRATGADGAGTTVYTYTNDTLLAQAGATTYNWDDNGNLTGRGADTFSYDYANRITRTVASGVTTTYSYNGDGLRVAKGASGGSSGPMVWDAALGLPQVISDANYVYIYGLGPIGMVDPQGNDYYFLRDGLGSVTGVANASGVLTATYSYDAYGNLKSSTGSVPNAVRYVGEWHDAETGLYYLRARYYDPAVGRFITRDPWPGFPQRPYSLNPYMYVENNPINAVDPSGLFAVGLCLNGSLGLGVYGSVTLCVLYASGREVGLTVTWATGGTTGVTGSVSGGLLFSNANKVTDLRGPFVTVGLSARLGPGIAGDFFIARNG